MFALLREKHQEWSLKLQEKIDLMRSQNPSNPLIRELESQKQATDMDIIRLGSMHTTKTAIDKIGAEMRKSSSGSLAEDTHNSFISVIESSSPSVGYLMFSTFWKNFNLNDRIQILHNIINNGHVQNMIEYQDPVSGLKAAELLLPTASHSQEGGMNRGVFNFLLPRSTVLDVVDENGDTALSIMVRQNIPSNVKKLLEKGASVLAPKKDLWFELVSNFINSTAILDEFDMPTDQSGLWISSKLHVAYDPSQIIVRRLQEEGKVYNSVREGDGYSISSDNAIKIIKLLSEYGLDINGYISDSNGDQSTIFHALALCKLHVRDSTHQPIDNIWMLKELINIPAFDINAQHIGGTTPFMVACSENIAIALALANKENFNVNLVAHNGYGPIHYLARLVDSNLSKTILDILLEKGADINLHSCDKQGNTPLSFFLERKNIELVEYLLTKHHIDLVIPRTDGLYPIHIAAASCDSNVIELLLQAGASLTQESSCTEKHSPLKLAQKYCNIDAAEYIYGYLSNDNLPTDTIFSKVYMELKPKILICNEEIAKSPDNWEWYYKLGLVLEKMGNTDSALINYNKAIELNIGAAEAFTRKGAVLRNLDRFEEALDSANQAISLNEYCDEAYSVKALSLRGLRKFDEALVNYDKAISLNTYEASYYSNKGYIFLDLGRFQEAKECFDIAISKSPNNPMYYCNKGDSLVGLGLVEEASSCYDIADQINKSADLSTNLTIVNMSYIDSKLSMDRKELILKVQELQALSLASINSASSLDPSDPIVEAINKNNAEVQDIVSQVYGSNSTVLELEKTIETLVEKIIQQRCMPTIISRVDDLINSMQRNTENAVLELQAKIEDVQNKNSDDINRVTELCRVQIDELHKKQDAFPEMIRLSQEYNQELIEQLEQRLSAKQVDFTRMREDLLQYQNHMSDLENKISILQEGIVSTNTTPYVLERLQSQLAQYYEEMIQVKEDAAYSRIAIQELEPVWMKINAHLKEQEQSEAQMQSIFDDPYKQSFYNHMVQQLNVVYLASSVVQSDIVSNNKSGALGNAGSIMRFVGAYVPVIGFAVQLCGTVLSKIDSAQQKIIVQNLFDIANSPVDFNDIAQKLSTILLRNDDISEILDFAKLNETETLAHKVQKILGGIAGNIFNNIGSISNFIHGGSTDKTQIALSEVTKLLQDEINRFVIDVKAEETNELRISGITHGGIISSIIISKIYKGEANKITGNNNNHLKASILLDFALDEYGVISQEIYSESDKVAFKIIDHYKTLLNLDSNYSEEDEHFKQKIAETLLEKSCYRKLLSKSMNDVDICNEIALHIATKFSANNTDIARKMSEMISEVVVHPDFASHILESEGSILLAGDSMTSSLDG